MVDDDIDIPDLIAEILELASVAPEEQPQLFRFIDDEEEIQRLLNPQRMGDLRELIKLVSGARFLRDTDIDLDDPEQFLANIDTPLIRRLRLIELQRDLQAIYIDDDLRQLAQMVGIAATTLNRV